mmetsp:Transcript_6216/g.16246  ORF Transcript_6216/g.16246 Transcript_6216/m.16246 type:complete len:81 (+) Transcript_6216:443-685(+)
MVQRQHHEVAFVVLYSQPIETRGGSALSGEPWPQRLPSDEVTLGDGNALAFEAIARILLRPDVNSSLGQGNFLAACMRAP